MLSWPTVILNRKTLSAVAIGYCIIGVYYFAFDGFEFLNVGSQLAIQAGLAVIGSLLIYGFYKLKLSSPTRLKKTASIVVAAFTVILTISAWLGTFTVLLYKHGATQGYQE